MTTRRFRRSTPLACLVTVAFVAACGPTAAPASQALATLRIDPIPSAAAAASSHPSASPTDAAIAAFVDRVTADGFGYHVALNGRSRHSADILQLSGTLDVGGSDDRLVVDVRFPKAKGTSRVEQRAVGGKSWVRLDGSAWRRADAFAGDDAPNLFARIADVSDVTLLGSEAGAQPGYRIELDAMLLHPALIPAVNLTAETVDRSRLSLVIDAEGRPLKGSWTMRGTGRVSGQLQEVVIELDVTFSKVGTRVTVAAP